MVACNLSTQKTEIIVSNNRDIKIVEPLTKFGAVVVAGGVGIAGAINLGVYLTCAGAATSILSGFDIDGGTY